jgi:hypothetical protein
MTASPFQLVPLSSLSEEARIDLLGCCFDREIDADWYRWKYRDSPWGATHGVIGVDEAGPAGVVHSIPWRLFVGEAPATGTRMLDSGTVERVRRRGLFREMVAHEVEGQRSQLDRLSFCTTTPNSTAALRAIGATVLEFPSNYSVGRRSVRLAGARLEFTAPADAVRHYAIPTIDTVGLGTAWSPEALAWRFDPRSGRHYRGAVLSEADVPTGLVYRVESRRGLRVIAAILRWGTHRGNEALLGAVARSERAPVVLDLGRTGRVKVSRGRTFMCVWDFSPRSRPQPTVSRAWRFELVDAEGVM